MKSVKQKSKLRVGDLVVVIAGKDKGKRGTITSMLLRDGRTIVSGVNEVKRHQKPSQKNPQGGIVTEEAPVHLSNLMIVDPTTQKPTRIGTKMLPASAGQVARKVRVAKMSSTVLDGKREK